jgi:hypothetical protein
MRPKTIGRTLGIGLRVATRVAGRRLATPAPISGHLQPNQQVSTPLNHRTAGQAAGRASRGLFRGISGFLRPFAKVGHALWLEIVGVFFLLPVLIFGTAMWRMRANWNHGPNHNIFLISGGIVIMFVYLSVTSFWRAWRK